MCKIMSLDALCSEWSNGKHKLKLSLMYVFETGGMIYSVEVKVTIVKREPGSLSK